MRSLRFLIFAATAGLAFALPYSEVGTLGIHLIVPALLGVLIASLFADLSVRARAFLLLSVVGGIALTRICWEAVVVERGDWTFDGEQDLVAMSVVIQLFFASAAFIAALLAIRKRRHAS